MSGDTVKLIEKKVEELYNSLMNKPLRVLDIFNDFFGEDKVDMQGYLSLDEFKSWLRTEPLTTYIPDGLVTDMSDNDWNAYKVVPITSLPEGQVKKVISAVISDIVKEKIGNIKFNRIFILVHFPHVRVTNEYDRFVDINHLWAKTNVMYDGTMNGRFTLNRSEYTLLHIRSNFLHSHVLDIPRDDFTKFQFPCLGSGPISNTINILNRDYDEDIWNMFCLELSKYVTVESVAGVPYHHLENLGTEGMEAGVTRFITYLSPDHYQRDITSDKLREFVRYFINSKKLKFNYVNGSYSIGMSFIEFIVLISNEFIEWYNDQFNKGELTVKFADLKHHCFLRECIISNGSVYYDKNENNIDNYAQYVGKRVCTFKGREITINITDIAEARNRNKSIILNTSIALYILTIILKVLNYRYGRDETALEDNKSGAKVRYL